MSRSQTIVLLEISEGHREKQNFATEESQYDVPMVLCSYGLHGHFVHRNKIVRKSTFKSGIDYDSSHSRKFRVFVFARQIGKEEYIDFDSNHIG